MCLFLRSYFLILIQLLLTIAPVLSLLAVLQLQKELLVQVVSQEEQIMREQTAPFHIVLDNPTWWPALQVKLELGIDNPFMERQGDQRLCLPVHSRSQNRFRLPLRPTELGIVRVRVKAVWVQDILGLVWFSGKRLAKEPAMGECLVLPRGEETDLEKAAQTRIGLTQSEESQAPGSDFSQISDIREYIPGDRLKDIHWKLSAKRETLLVKERVNISQDRLVLLAGFSEDRQGRSLVAQQVWQLARMMLGERTQVLLLWWDGEMSAFQQYAIETYQELCTAFGRMYQTWSPVEGGSLLSLMRRNCPGFGTYLLAQMEQEGVAVKVVGNDGPW